MQINEIMEKLDGYFSQLKQKNVYFQKIDQNNQ